MRADALTRALSDREPNVRRAAARAFGQGGIVEDENQTSALAQAMRDEDSEVRVAAAQALTRVGKAALPHAGIVAQALADPDASV